MRKILILYQGPQLGKYLALAYTAAGWDASWFLSSEGFLKGLEATPGVEVVVFDYNQTASRVVDLCRRIRSTSTLSHIGILVIDEYSQVNTVSNEMLRSAGVDVVIGKEWNSGANPIEAAERAVRLHGEPAGR